MPPVTVILTVMCECVDCICVTQDGDWNYSFGDLVAIGSINGNKSL